LYSLAQQTKVQQQMNHTMAAIDQSIVTTTGLTKQTSQELTPLTSTTTALANIEEAEEQTVRDLVSMNNHLQTIAQSEQSIVDTVASLNQETKGASTQLTALKSINEGILGVTTTAAGQAQTEARQVGQLNSLTSTAIREISTVNGRLAILKALP
jgi:hypothetical protein